jgi:hypothetical protein
MTFIQAFENAPKIRLHSGLDLAGAQRMMTSSIETRGPDCAIATPGLVDARRWP